MQFYSMCNQTSRNRNGQDLHSQIVLESGIRIDEEVAYSLNNQIAGQLFGKANPARIKSNE